MANKKNKKTNKGNKGEKISATQLEQRLRALFQSDSKGRFDTKQLVDKLGISNNRDSMEFVLNKLIQEGLINQNRIGKYKLVVLGEEEEKFEKEAAIEQKKGYESQIATGFLDMTRSGSGFVVSDDSGLDKDIFVPAGRLGNALHGDKVSVRFRLTRRRPEGEIIRVIERHADHFIGTLVLSKQYCFVTPDNLNMPFDIIIDPTSTHGATDGDKVVVAVKQWHNASKNKSDITSPVGVITAVLGKAGSADIEMQAIVLEHGFSLSFPDEVMAENDAISETISEAEIATRLDMRSITTFTIDPLTAKDFDDALSFRILDSGNYEIGVHIADVSHYVTPNSELDKEAAKRTTSVYLVDRVIPMLPEKLSNNLCSLRPNEDKLTFSSVFEFTPKGDLVGEWFGKTIIHSDRRFTYEEVQEILEAGEGEYSEELKILNRIAQQLKRERFKAGSINFESPEVQFKLDETGKPIGIQTKIRKDAHFLIEDFMLLSNRRVAALISEANKHLNPKIPFVYRIHDLPDMEKVASYAEFAKVFGYSMKIKSPEQVARAITGMLKEAEGKGEYDILQQLAIRTMAKAAYSTHNIGHYGLAFNDYSHFTSPIRRYSDVLAHRILFEYLQKKPIRFNEEKLEEVCKHISQKERKAMEAERASVKYKQVEFIQDHVGGVFLAVITGMTERGIFAEIRANRCEGLIRFDNMFDQFNLLPDGFHIKSPNHAFRMGDFVWVRVLSANLGKRQIDMEMLNPKHVAEEYPEVWGEAQLELNKFKQETATNTTSDTKQNDLKSKMQSWQTQAATLFAQSNIQTIAKEKGAQWNYAWAETPLLKNTLCIVEFNPTADKVTNFDAQTKFPTSFEQFHETDVYKTLQTQLESEFDTDVIEKTMYLYACPFRSEREDQIQAKDYKATNEVFMDILATVPPRKIISFSSHWREYVLASKQLENVVEDKVAVGKRSFVIIKGVLKVGELRIPTYFLPSLKVKIPKEVREEALKLLLANS